MRSAAIAFLCGTVLLLRLPELPDLRWCLLLICLIPLLLFAARLRFLMIMGCGFLLALWHAGANITAALPAELQGRDLNAIGTVTTRPRLTATGSRFNFTIEHLYADSRPLDFRGRVRLTWYRHRGPLPQAGQRWRLHLRLKRPHGFSNPGTFDYEAWLLQNRILATGYIRDDNDNRRIDDSRNLPLWRAWRQALIRRLNRAVDGEAHGGMLTALAVGDRDAIPDRTWDTLRDTGTSHLIAISGLHIGVIAAVAFGIGRRLWAAIPYLALRWPAPAAGALAGLGGALIYAALAGFSLPTQRALIMVSVVLLSIMARRHYRPGQTLATALLVVLLVDPLAVLSSSFWLSFTAVTIILFGMNNRLQTGQTLAQRSWWRWGRLHVLVAIGLMPLLLLLFHRLPLVSPLANVIAVPWVSALVVPAVLGGTLLLGVSQTLAHVLLSLAGLALSALWPLLSSLADMTALQWTQHAQPTWAQLSAAFAVMLVLLPRGLPGRAMSLLWLVPLLFNPPPRPAPGAMNVTLLDVGQGLATVVETHDHVLVYDTGARFSPDFDAGDAVVVPFLRHFGWQRVDRLVIGHGDNDHIGGTESLLRQIPVRTIVSSVPDRIPRSDARPCREHQHWRWDGVDFELLHPNASAAWRGNNASCVLRVGNGDTSLLLSGDIEAFAESRLIAERPRAIDSDILVAPHHGSNTSSTGAFIAATRPADVLLPVGYRNRFGFPDARVIARYQQAGARIWRTDRDGAIQVTITPGQHPMISAYRAGGRFWVSRPSRY